MKHKHIYLYAFIAIAVLLSSAKFLKGNRTNNEVCTKGCKKTNSGKTSGPELFSLHFISIIK